MYVYIVTDDGVPVYGAPRKYGVDSHIQQLTVKEGVSGVNSLLHSGVLKVYRIRNGSQVTDISRNYIDE